MSSIYSTTHFFLTMKPLFLFYCELRQKSSLINGRLILIDKDKDKIIKEFTCCSGSPGYQTIENLDTVGKGALPEASMIGIDHFEVATNELYSNLKGIEGAYFNIFPREFIINGTKRSLGEIHRDANMPGTAMCLGVLNSQWEGFRATMKNLRNQGFKLIPLLSHYSRG